MNYASNSHSAAGFDHLQSRRAAQLMVLAAGWNATMAASARLFAAFAERRRIARNLATLESLSDRTLADIGISRDQIPYIARHGRDAARL